MTVGKDRILAHDGGTGGDSSFIAFDPDRHVGVVLLANSSTAASDIALHLVNRAVPLAAPPVQRTAADVPVTILSRYTGVYQLDRSAPEFAFNVTLENGALYVEVGGQKDRLYAESETKFFSRAIDAQITFVIDTSGATTGLILHQLGMNRVGKKVR